MIPPPITTASAWVGSWEDVSMRRRGWGMMVSIVCSGLCALRRGLYHVELRDALAALPSDGRTPGHENCVACLGRQDAAVRAGEPHATGQQMHELVHPVRTHDAVIGRRVP